MPIKSLTDPVYVFPVSGMNITQAVKLACEQPTLVDALTLIAVWDCERTVKQAKEFFETGISTAGNGEGWETCFRTCFEAVMEAWNKKPMTIDEWFDPNNPEHLLAYRHLQQEGLWPKGFIPDNVSFPSMWGALVDAKISEAWIDFWLNYYGKEGTQKT